MRKHRLPLRQYKSVSNDNKSINDLNFKNVDGKLNENKDLAKNKKRDHSSILSNNLSIINSNKVKKDDITITRSKIDDEDDEWKRIEDENNNDNNHSDKSDDHTSDSDDDSANQINIEGSIEHMTTEDYTFEFNDMRDTYCEGITVLLRDFIINPTYAYQLAHVITNQTIVGTVINCEGGEDAFAFATVLPLIKYKNLHPLKELFVQLEIALNELIKQSNNSTTIDPINLFLESISSTSSSQSTGLMIHKRFSNLPIQLIGPLHRNLEDDLLYAKQLSSSNSNFSNNKQNNFTFSDNNNNNKILTVDTSVVTSVASFIDDDDHLFNNIQYLLLFSPITSSHNDILSTSTSSNNIIDVTGNSSLIFHLFEDEIFFQNCSIAYLFKPSSSISYIKQSLQVAMLIPVSKLKLCINNINKLAAVDE
eukprot:gene11686-15648_t